MSYEAFSGGLTLCKVEEAAFHKDANWEVSS